MLFLKPLLFAKTVSVLANMTSVNRLEPHYKGHGGGTDFTGEESLEPLLNYQVTECRDHMLFQYAIPPHRGLQGTVNAFPIEVSAKNFVLK